MTTYDMDSLTPVATTVTRLPLARAPAEDDLPTVTVQGHFDWKFWAGLAVGAVALYVLFKSMKHAR